MKEGEVTIWTIGHSTRTLDGFLGLLSLNGIEAVADVRRFPGSRKYPHFDLEALRDSLSRVGVEYVPLPELGGRRRPRPDSSNTVWRNASFRGYADYMETGGFRAGIARLLELGEIKRTAIMCAEAVWWRCHRSMIADQLKVMGVCVRHIMGEQESTVHPYTAVARVLDGKLSYPSGI